MRVAVRVRESPFEPDAAVSMLMYRTITAASSEKRVPPEKSSPSAGKTALQRYKPKSSAAVGFRVNLED